MEVEKQVQNLRLEDVLPNRFQPRIKFSEDSINELANSIKEHGVIQPIVVRRIGDKYEIIAGERRYKASQIAGKETIPAIVSDLNDNDSAEIALLENVQRENLTPIEEAISYKKILDMGYTQEQLAQKIGNKQSTIANKVRLLNLTDEVQEALLENKISERHARSLLKISNAELQVKMLERIIAGRFTVRKTDEEIEKLLKGELEMNENNEIRTTIPTSKIYEEEAPIVVEAPQVAPIPTVEQINTQVEVAPVPLEVVEKVEPIMPIMEPQPVKDTPFDTKFLEKETFVNMPMHSIPTEQPLGENSEYRDGKYFELEKEKEAPKVDNTFNNIFGGTSTIGNEIPVEKIEDDKLIMPTFDFSTVSPLDNIETVSFGEEVPVATPSFTTSLTELPAVDDLSNVTANIPTLEEMSNGLNNTEEIKIEPVATAPVLENIAPIVSLENVEIPTVNTDSVISTPTIEPVVNTMETPVINPVEPTYVEAAPTINTEVAPVMEVPTIEPITTPVEEVITVGPTYDVPAPVVEASPVVEATVPAIEPEKVELPTVNTELPVENVDVPVMREYTIPTFDPEIGSSMEIVNEDIKPVESPVIETETPVLETSQVAPLPTEIKLPLDIESINSLKNDFLKLLQDKGFNVSVEDMDLADNYKLIFTIEK